MQTFSQFSIIVEKYLDKSHFNENVPELYNPVNYILGLPAKRVRPVLFLLSHQLYNPGFEKVMPVAIALEWFHNFTLIHDDIMDESPLRRGKPTVHSHFGINSAILSGDALLIYVYKYLNQYVPEKHLKEVLTCFNDTAIKVCEGQQMDIDFENDVEVSFQNYELMIANKTAVLLACALKLGAILGEATQKDKEYLYSFGLNLGLAFQIQDDYLDIYGETTLVGKQKAGDIIQCKKNVAYVIALEKLMGSKKKSFIDLYMQKPEDPSKKLMEVYEIYDRLNMKTEILDRKHNYQELTADSLKKVSVDASFKVELENLSKQLLDRAL